MRAQLGEARSLPPADGSVDIVLLIGPLYHLVEADERATAPRKASRVVRPGGVVLAEVITRHAWIRDATRGFGCPPPPGNAPNTHLRTDGEGILSFRPAGTYAVLHAVPPALALPAPSGWMDGGAAKGAGHGGDRRVLRIHSSTPAELVFKPPPR